MDYITVLVSFSFAFACIYVLINSSSTRRKSSRLPPGPYPFPIFGNIFQLGPKPHQTLAQLSKKYGPFMSLKMGSRTAIVVSSPKFAKEILQKHDQAFSSRAVPAAARVLNHDKFSMMLLPAESRWRSLRKICKEQLFSLQQLDAGQDLRRKKAQELLSYVNKCSKNGEAVVIGRAAFTTSLNLLTNTFFSIDLAHYHTNSSQEFKDIVWAVLEQLGRPNLADYFPVLSLFDLQGIRRRTEFYVGKLYAVFEGMINQRLQSRTSLPTSSVSKDVLDALLGAQWSHDEMKPLFLDLFMAGTDTTSSTVEWAMAELLRNPEKMAEARSELLGVLGKDTGVIIQESDVSRLPYLQAVVKETLRLHPPVPFLVPHKSESDAEVDGFMVPKNAQVLVNVWAMGRDSNIWSNPNSFEPERFLDREIDFRGIYFELIPFGAGRRICPGLPLAYRMVHLMLASLLRSYDWKLEEGMKPEELDMSEQTGFTLQKAVPLKAIPVEG